jgi:hypothetical protein
MQAIDLDLARRFAMTRIRSEIARLKWLAAATRFEIAMRRHDRALKYGYKYGYNPAQPRVPAGNSDGGQWTTVSSGGGISIALPASVVSADDGTGSLDDIGDAGDFGGTGEAQDFGLDWVQLAGDIPTGDSPEIPEEPPPTSPARTAALKTVARLLGPTATVAEIAQLGAWYRTYSALIQSYSDPPKTLDDLQKAASTPAPGYDVHHIVERNQEGVFSKEVINGPDNLVLIPRLKHQEINGWFQTKNPEFGGESPRDYLDGRSWGVQRAVGLFALRKFGVLKP